MATKKSSGLEHLSKSGGGNSPKVPNGTITGSPLPMSSTPPKK
jgi:hypothetical protein